MNEALLLIVTITLGTLWLKIRRNHEQATSYAREYCRRASLQLLDDTVSLRRQTLRREKGHLCWYREYVFEYAREGVNRYPGRMVMRNDTPVLIRLDEQGQH